MHELELTDEEVRDAARLLGETICRYHDDLPGMPVYPEVDREAIQNILKAPLPEYGQSVESLFREFQDVVIPNSTQTPHPRFLGYVLASPTGIAPFAEALAATINQNCTIWTLGPAAAAIEQTVLNWFLKLFEFPPGGGGIFTSGGSMANTIALAVARDHHYPGNAGEDGLQALDRPLTVYGTDEVHRSVHKAVAMLGLGTRNYHTVEYDSQYRLRLDDLKEKVRADKSQGAQPFCVIASAGTVATGAIDPLSEIADFCAEEGLWFHVDGAYGAFAVLDERVREALLPAGRGDSLALDPHKLLFNPLEAGCVLVRDRRTLTNAFHMQASYIGEYNDRELLDYMDYGPQLSRNFKALKVWWSLRAAGIQKYQAVIKRVLDLAKYMGDRIEGEKELELMAQVTLTSVCFRCRSLDNAQNEELLNALVDGGKAFLTRANLRDRFCLRACFTNFRTTQADVDLILDEVLRLSRAA